MPDTAIRVENLGKRYELGEIVNAGRALRTAGRALGFGRNDADDRTELWALRNVSFEVKRGEVLGVIGRNGAGKSTLLKILSRVTKPTEGYAELRGRVGSLLEVGTGFHPELTGRDNIYLNGAILGMKKREIDRRLDEIIDFSGIEKFLDTPVKRYSSGMYTRLGFAVAAHLDTEILICDEVLAVGDFGFQKRCIGKMGEVAKQGRAVLVVSHNMATVSRLCTRALLLADGQLTAEGDASQVVELYLNNSRTDKEQALTSFRTHTTHNNAPIYQRIVVNDQAIPGDVHIRTGDCLQVELSGNVGNRHVKDFRAGIHFDSTDGIRILSCATPWSNLGHVDITGAFTFRCTIDTFPLVPGTYLISVGAGGDGQVLEWLDHLGALNVHPHPDISVDLMPTYKTHGYILTPSSWSVTPSRSS